MKQPNLIMRVWRVGVRLSSSLHLYRERRVRSPNARLITHGKYKNKQQFQFLRDFARCVLGRCGRLLLFIYLFLLAYIRLSGGSPSVTGVYFVAKFKLRIWDRMLRCHANGIGCHRMIKMQHSSVHEKCLNFTRGGEGMYY